jgi:DNA modification methylase
MNTQHRIIFGDSRYLDDIKDNSIQLVVTSPPYWQLKDYDHSDQIGFKQSYPEYIKSLNQVWAECLRVLEPECRLCVNIGDQFTRTDIYGRYKIIPIREEIIRFCESIGFDYMGAIIWQKVTTCNTSGGASIMGSFPYPRNGILKMDYEFILIFKKLGKNKRKIDRDVKEKSRLSREEWKEWFNGHWYFPGERQEEHIAMFPIELPKRLIKMFTFAGETVLDPFLGSGSTSAAALLTDRNSVGYEINRDLRDIILNKLNGHINLTNLDRSNISFEYRERTEDKGHQRVEKVIEDIRKMLSEVKSIFHETDGTAMLIDSLTDRVSAIRSWDNNMSEKSIDLIIGDVNRIKGSGSTLKAMDKKRIDACTGSMVSLLNSMKSEYFYTYENIKRVSQNYEDYKSIVSKRDREKDRGLVKVTGILDVNLLRIETGDTVRLGGIKPFDNEFIKAQALGYLKDNVLNQKVEIDMEDEEKKIGYVKLKNKTHINAKLIKEGLAQPDSSTTKKFSDRFTKYFEQAKEGKKGYWSLL